MYKKLCTLFMLLMSATVGSAQRYKSYGGTLNIYSTDVPFFLYINNVLYNNRPSADIRLTNLQRPRYNLRIVFADRQRRTLNGRGVQLVNREGTYMDVVFSVSSRRGNNGIILESMNPVGQYNSNYQNDSRGDINSYNQGHSHRYPRTQNNNSYEQGREQNELYGYNTNTGQNEYNDRLEKSDANQLNDLLNEKQNDQDRLNLAVQGLKNRRLRVSEIIDLMELFVKDDSKLAFATYAYQSCIDKQNYERVGDALSFTSTREKLTEFMKNQR